MADPGETRRIETLAGDGSRVSGGFDAGGDPHGSARVGEFVGGYGLFVFYLANGILIMMLLRRRQVSTAAFRLLVHAGDITWPAVISLFAEGPRTPFFSFLFLFVLAAAAYRSGVLGNAGHGGGRSGAAVDREFYADSPVLGPQGSLFAGAARPALECANVRAGTAVSCFRST